MTSEFKQFVSTVRTGIANGNISTSKMLSDFDLAVTFAIGKIGEQRGYPLTVTAEDINNKIMEFAPELTEEANNG